MTVPFHIIMSKILGFTECELPNDATIDLKIKKVIEFSYFLFLNYKYIRPVRG